MLAVLKRYFIDPSGKKKIVVYYDFACGLVEVVLNRDVQAATGVVFKHDR